MLKFLKNYPWLSVFTLGVVLYALFCGVVLDVDSESYISNGIFRSPIYPLLISASTKLFGSAVYKPVIVCQIFLVMLGAIYLSNVLRKAYTLSERTQTVIVAILVLPYLMKWGNFLLTQGVAYGLLLLVVAHFLQWGFRQSWMNWLWGLFFLAICVLTRRQFVFMYPVGVFLVLLIAYVKKQALSKSIACLLVLVGSFFMTDALEKTYHYVVHGKYTTVPFLGIQLAVAPMYLATEVDANLFQDPLEKDVFIKAYQKMKQDCSNAECEFGRSLPPYAHYYLNYNRICWEAIWPAARYRPHQDAYTVDKMLIGMSKTLIMAHWDKWGSLFLLNVINNMGGYYYTALLLFAFFGFLVRYQKKQDAFSLGVVLVLLVNAGNYALIALVELAFAPYQFYTNTLVLVVMGLVILKQMTLSSSKGKLI